MNARIDNVVSRNVRRVSGLALVLMMACSPAMAAKPGSAATPMLVDAWLPYAVTGVYLDVTTGDLCAGSDPVCQYISHVSFAVNDVDGVRATAVPDQARVAILRNVRFDEVSASLANQAFVKFASAPIRDVQFTDTLLVESGGTLHKVGFIQCHVDAEAMGVQLAACERTNSHDTDDDAGGWVGDSGLRMSVVALD